MKLTEQVLQQAVARYCSEYQDEITSGRLSLDQLNEGILSGIRGIFDTNSAVNMAAGSLATKAVGKLKDAKQAIGQGVQRIKDDYVAGDASAELRGLARERNQAEVGFNEKLDHFKANVRSIQQERYTLKREHKQILKQFHQSSHAQYIRAATALQIPVAKGDAFYQAVDQALEARHLVPTAILNESWGVLEEKSMQMEEETDETPEVPTF